MRAIEIYNGWIPVPDSWGVPVNGLHDTRLNELHQLRADKKMSSINLSVTPPLESLSDDETSELITLHKEKKLCLSSLSSTNILHQPSSIHRIPAGIAPVDSPLGIGIRSPPHNDSVA